MSKSKRILFIDFAKALAIVLVVIGHYIPHEHPDWYGNMREIIYGFHMPLFMFTSGFVYVATVRQESYGSFLLRKFKRLMIPYFVVSILVISIKFATQGTAYVENPVTLMSYVRMFYMPKAGPFLWFLWALWWIFVVVPVFNNKYKRLIMLALAIVIYYLPVSFTVVFCLDGFKKMFVYFCLGCATNDYKDSLKKVGKIPLYVFMVLFVIINYLYINNLLPSELQKSLTPLIGIAFVLSLCKWLEQKNRISLNSLLLIIASSSYIIYLLHTTFEGFAKDIVHKIPILMDAQNDLMFTLGAAIVISCGIIVPILLDRFVLRKYRLTRFLFGYKYNYESRSDRNTRHT